VSHQPQRKETDCLNCGTVVKGRFCQHCGQENIVTKQGFWSLSRHFIYDIFHFDGKFFDTLRPLLTRPGFVPREYVQGRRMHFLDPIRMYLFTSALFFLIFFAVRDTTIQFNGRHRTLSRTERMQFASTIYDSLSAHGSDSGRQRQLKLLLDTAYQIQVDTALQQPLNDSSFLIELEHKKYLMTANRTKPLGSITIGSGWLNKKIDLIKNHYGEKYADNPQDLFGDILQSFLHKLPYMLFISLPFFALILKLLYVRRKNFYYSDHAVFTLYHYIFSFLLLLLYFFVDQLDKWLHWKVFVYLAIALFLYGGAYLFIAMRRFYRQGFGKTLSKFLLLNFLAFIVLLVLFLVFLIFSIVQF
jgi:hypothetical protein